MNEELQEDELPAPTLIENLPPASPLPESTPERRRKKKSKSSSSRKRSKSQERDKKSKSGEKSLSKTSARRSTEREQATIERTKIHSALGRRQKSQWYLRGGQEV